jgi:heptosyltransferase II
MNIAVFCPNWIGDVVMATPAMTALRRHFADARFIGVMKPYVAGVLEGGPWFDAQYFTQGKSWPTCLGSVAWKLRRESIDLSVLFPNSFRSALLAWMGGSRRIVGYARDKRSWMLTDRLVSRVGQDGKFLPTPIIDDYNRLAEHVGCSWPGHRMTLPTTSADEDLTDRIWQHYGLEQAEQVIALNPGAAFGAAKHWPESYFATVARRWATERKAAVLVLCGPSEVEMAKRIVAQAQHHKVHSLAEEPVSLGLLKACVKRADLLITTDSGPRHFAAAFQKPVVTLFGPTHIPWTETYHPQAVHLQKPVPCGPCQLRVCPLDHRCMKDLTPAEVFHASVQLLERAAKKQPVKSGWSWLASWLDIRRKAC